MTKKHDWTAKKNVHRNYDVIRLKMAFHIFRLFIRLLHLFSTISSRVFFSRLSVEYYFKTCGLPFSITQTIAKAVGDVNEIRQLTKTSANCVCTWKSKRLSNTNSPLTIHKSHNGHCKAKESWMSARKISDSSLSDTGQLSIVAQNKQTNRYLFRYYSYFLRNVKVARCL